MSASPAAGTRGKVLVSALYDAPEQVDRALALLVTAGLPRDLADVVVPRRLAESAYGRRVRRPGRETLRYAGIGALAGLVAGGALSLALLALPGRSEMESAILIQLLGPNVTTLLGALVGGAIGLFVRRRPDPLLARAARAEEGILLAVRARSPAEAEEVGRLLAEAGGRDVRSDRPPPVPTGQRSTG